MELTRKLVSGILGNLVSFLVYLAPIPTFIRVYRNRSTGEFHPYPYVVSLFSAMLWMYYAILKIEVLLMTINTLGCIIESLYVIVYLSYAPRNVRENTLKLVAIVIIGLFGLIVLVTMFSFGGSKRVKIVEWICMIFSVCVFAAPLSTMRLVIQTRRVESIPLLLSVFLTLSAIVWFFFGRATHDLRIWIPNIIGFIFGLVQIVLYLWLRNPGEIALEMQDPQNEPEQGQP